MQNHDLQENSISSPTTPKRENTYGIAQKDSMVLPFSSSETAHATTPAHWSSTSAPPYYYYCCFCCLPHRSKHALASSILDTAFCCHAVLLQILPISSHQPLLVPKMIIKTVLLFFHLLSPPPLTHNTTPSRFSLFSLPRRRHSSAIAALPTQASRVLGFKLLGLPQREIRV